MANTVTVTGNVAVNSAPGTVRAVCMLINGVL